MAARTNASPGVFVVSGPSGSGKTSLCDEALKRITHLNASISHTTRPPRPKEQNGIDYYFVDRATFDAMVERGEFMEWAEVHGHRYGTSHEVVRNLSRRGSLLFEVDCRGAREIRKQLPQAVLIFVMTPSFYDLVSRIQNRGRVSPGELSIRMHTAEEEIRQVDFFHYVLINDVFSEAFERLQSILLGQPLAPQPRLSEWLEKWDEEIRRYEGAGQAPEST